MTRRYTGGLLSATEQITDANTANGIFTLQEAGALTASGNFPTGRWTPQRSLRFRRSASAYLTRTPSSASGQDKWTLSTWVKRGALGDSSSQIIGGNTTTSGGTRNVLQVEFGSDNALWVYAFTNASGYYFQRTSNQLFRDPSAWYHLVVQFDPDNATSANKVIAYINGQPLSWSTSSDSGAAGNIGSSSYRSINNTFRNDINGGYQGGGVPIYFGDQYLSEMNMVSGSLVEPSAFAITDPQTGTWIPKRYTGTYGTNGFYLDFRDNSAATAGAIGADRSGNGNNWTPNSLSVTAGVTYDSMVDVPGIASVTSQPDIGGVQRGNYATWSQLTPPTQTSLSQGNLFSTATGSSTNVITTFPTPTTGKWYAEITMNFSQNINWPIVMGVSDGISGNTYLRYYTDWSARAINKSVNGVTSSVTPSGALPVNGDILKIAYDADAGNLWLGLNSTWYGASGSLTGAPETGNDPTLSGVARKEMYPNHNSAGGPAQNAYLNCGQRPFTYTPPTGFKSLNTTNFPNPVIKRPSDHFDVKTYTGNGTALTVGTIAKQSSAYSINKSLRFRASASAYLTRTLTTPTSAKAWTFSAWVKRAKIGSAQSIFISTLGGAGVPQASSYFTSSDTIQIYDYTGSAYTFDLTTSQTFKDTSAWYHLVFVYDSAANATSNRVRLYVNGTQITSFSSASFPSLNADCSAFNRAYAHYLSQGNAQYFDGYMAEVNFVDGQSLTPASFGQFDANNNWFPKTYTGTYGTNGFKLDFSDNSSATNVLTGNSGIGKDSSSNNNYWNSNNINTYGGTVQSYTTVGTTSWTAPAGVTSVNYLVVAGGGGGGGGDSSAAGSAGAGGGAGGLLTGTMTVIPGNSYTVTVGGGGNSGTVAGTGSSGSNSVFNTITAIGGGGGGSGYADGFPARATGLSGGSGGGSGGITGGTSPAGGAGTSGQGFAGGGSQANRAGASGGGASGVGIAGANNSSPGGAGPSGLSFNISGSSVTYAGGGGGGGWGTPGTPVGNSTGGAGGGGAGGGSNGSGTAGTAGSTNLGGGGGGGGSWNTGTSAAGGAGGSGTVILAYGVNPSYDSMFDSPVDTVDSNGNTVGNYAVINRSSYSFGGQSTLSEGNLYYDSPNPSSNYAVSPIGSTLSFGSGKFYWEVQLGRAPGANGGYQIGAFDTGGVPNTGAGWTNSYGWFYNVQSGALTVNGQSAGSVAAAVNGDIIGLAFDRDNGIWRLYKNGTLLTTQTSNPQGDGRAWLAGANIDQGFNNGREIAFRFNFGQRAFAYTPPAGHKSLNTKNLKDVGSYNLPDTFGNFVNTPDLVWIRNRTVASGGGLFNTVIGPTRFLQPTNTNGSATTSGELETFLPNGFLLGTNGNITNNSTNSYVGWAWNRGKIPGFDIVNYAEVAGNNSIKHNLGVVPKVVLMKSLSIVENWVWWQESFGTNQGIYLNSNIGTQTAGANWITVNSSSIEITSGQFGSPGSKLLYLWAEVPGFSKFGTYTGNTSADGPFIYCGFKPKYLLIKKTNGTDSWIIYDSARNTYNGMQKWLVAHATDTEYDTSTGRVDFVSNGFKIRTADAGPNTGNFIYCAFAEAPFKYASAR